MDNLFKTSGTVAWIVDREDPGKLSGMGIEFLGVSDEDARRLLQVIVSSQLTQKGY